MELLATAVFIAVTTTFASALILIGLERKFKILCRDVHKPYEYFVPCIGGVPVYLGIALGIIPLYASNAVSSAVLVALLLSTTMGMAIGFLDDLVNLKSAWKIFLGVLPAAPLLITECYIPRPWIPFIGHARLYIVYPVLIVLASTVYVNGANMIDTHNGVLPSFTLITALFALLLKIFTTGLSYGEIVMTIVLIAALATYLVFNIYPAKLFNGNTGAFLMGSILLFITVFLRVEFYMLVTSIPMLLNGFYYISSVRGFLQKERVERPTYLDRNGCIYPGKSLHPVTFIKIVLALGGKPLSEKELIKVLCLIYLATATLSFVVCLLLGYC